MVVAATTTPELRGSSGGWVSSARWDLFWMFSALWGSALCYAVGLSVGHGRAGAILFAANTLLAVCHSWSTTYVVIASPLLRDARRRNRTKFTVVPIAVVAGSLLLGAAIGLSGGLPDRFPLTGQHWL
jgi:hypothetical protein